MQDTFYMQLEDRFRGSEKQISQRLQQYIPILEALESAHKTTAIDLGCGRGEWLALLHQRQWNVTGIDLNIAMVKRCLDQGFQADAGDALSYLKALPEQSQSLITGFHIAEHVSFDILLEIINEAYRVLMPEGVLLLETPNPENLQVGAHTFYMDPSHRQPLPPQLLHFSIQQQGFVQVGIHRLNGATRPANAMAFGDHIQWFLEANPDYAVIAQKQISIIPREKLNRIGETESHSAEFYARAREYVQQTHQRIEDTKQEQAEQSQQIQILLKQTRHLQEKAEQSNVHILKIERDQEELARIKNSRSWRITKPLRQLSVITSYCQRNGLKETIIHSNRVILRRLVGIAARNPRLRQSIIKVVNKAPKFKKYLITFCALDSVIPESNTALRKKHTAQLHHDIESPRALQIWQDLKGE
ncbi:MAG TPA: class I SAM-dependent methyltransferase [Methyloprofundus sp.]|nr:class I SAM-dependent methyltransferase [Methyloprofundus sp.]